MPHSVLIVDDQVIPRQLFEITVAASGRYAVAAAIDAASMADAWCARGGIDLILMDVVTNDGTNGLDVARRIKPQHKARPGLAAGRGNAVESAAWRTERKKAPRRRRERR